MLIKLRTWGGYSGGDLATSQSGKLEKIYRSFISEFIFTVLGNYFSLSLFFFFSRHFFFRRVVVFPEVASNKQQNQ